MGCCALPARASLARSQAVPGVQSALVPAGIEAADIARLSWWLFGGAAAIWSAVIALAVVASRSGHVSVVEHPTDRVSVSDAAKRRETRRGRQLIIGGGVM